MRRWTSMLQTQTVKTAGWRWCLGQSLQASAKKARLQGWSCRFETTRALGTSHCHGWSSGGRRDSCRHIFGTGPGAVAHLGLPDTWRCQTTRTARPRAGGHQGLPGPRTARSRGWWAAGAARPPGKPDPGLVGSWGCRVLGQPDPRAGGHLGLPGPQDSQTPVLSHTGGCRPPGQPDPRAVTHPGLPDQQDRWTLGPLGTQGCSVPGAAGHPGLSGTGGYQVLGTAGPRGS